MKKRCRRRSRTPSGKDPDKLVVFQGDPAVILADMVRILDIAKTAGAQQIAIAVAKTAGRWRRRR